METDTRPAVIFDFGNVLLDWDPRYLYRKFFPGEEERIDRFLEEVRFYEWNHLQDAGRPFGEAVAELSGQFPAYEVYIRAYDEHYPESISGPIPGTVEILKSLRKAGYALYGLSNWSLEKFRLVRGRYEFFDWFEEIVLSGEVKLAKPDPRIFALTLERLGRRAGECLLIDDSAANIAAARGLGFQTVQFRSPEQLGAELERMGLLSRNGCDK
jgi:2-haloacid dehalogenase